MRSTDILLTTFYNFSMGIRKIQNELGRKLKALRIDKGLTQEQLDFEVDISRDHLSHIQLGKHPVNIKTLYKLAQFFEVDMKYFF